MFVKVSCPKCKSSFNVDSRGLAGRELRCSKCKHYFKFSPPKEKPKPDSPLKATWKRFKERTAEISEVIGLNAFAQKVKGWLPGTSVLIGIFAVVVVGAVLVRVFAPGLPQSTGTGGSPQAAKPLTAKEREAEWLASNPLGYYQTKLRSHEAAERATAAKGVASMGKKAEPILAVVLEAADDVHPDVATAVDKALKAIGPPSKNNLSLISSALHQKGKPARAWALRLLAIPENADVAELKTVITYLNDSDAEVSQLAGKALTVLQTKDRKTVVSRLFQEKSDSAKRFLTQQLAEPGKVTMADLPGLVKYLNEPSPELRASATKALDNYSSAERKSVLLALAKEPSASASLYVAGFLAKPESGVMVETVPSLIEWLSAPVPELQKQSALALLNFGPEHADKVSNNPKLLALALNNKAQPARKWALQLLATPQNAAVEHLPGVIGLLSDAELSPLAEKAIANFQAKDRNSVVTSLLNAKETTAKLYITQHLSEPGKVALADLPGLVKCLGETNPELHKQTVKALDNYPAKDRKSVLLALVKEQDAPARMYAATALAQPDSTFVPEAIPSLLEWVSASNAELQKQSALALANCGAEHADKIRPPLMRLLLKNQDEQVTDALVTSVKALGTPGREELDELKSLTKDPRVNVRVFAWEMMARIELDKAEISRTFPPLFKDTEPRLRALALAPIAKLGKDAGPLIPELVKLLQDREAIVRGAAARTLAALGKDAAPARSQLVKALADDEPAVRVHATWALTALGEKLPGLAGFNIQVSEGGTTTVWKDGQYNGAPDLARLGDSFYIAWRVGKPNTGLPGKIVVRRSPARDLENWEKAKEFDVSTDAADPQLVAHAGRLCAYWTSAKDVFVSMSENGLLWSTPRKLDIEFQKADDGIKLASLSRIRSAPDAGAYCLARCISPISEQPRFVLLRSHDGVRFKALHTAGEGLNELLAGLGTEGLEADLAFLETGMLVAAIRTSKTGVIAFSDAPYQKWQGFDSATDFTSPSLWKSKYGVLLACRTAGKAAKESTTILSVTPTSLIQPLALSAAADPGQARIATGVADDEPLLVLSVSERGDDGRAMNIYLVKLKIQTGRISVSAK